MSWLCIEEFRHNILLLSGKEALFYVLVQSSVEHGVPFRDRSKGAAKEAGLNVEPSMLLSKKGGFRE